MLILRKFMLLFVFRSKSLSQRALVVAALAQGDSFIRNVLISQDTLYLIDGLRR